MYECGVRMYECGGATVCKQILMCEYESITEE